MAFTATHAHALQIELVAKRENSVCVGGEITVPFDAVNQ
jgi:hypothetical protein